MEIIKEIIAIFVNFFKALRDFLLGIKLDKVEDLSKFADGVGSLGDLLGKAE